MRRLWHDFRAHWRASVLFLLYWLATLVVIDMTWQPGGMARGADVLLLATPLIAGTIVGWWRGATEGGAHRSRDRITGGMLAGVLSVEISLMVMKGGGIEEMIGGMRGHGFQGGEVLGFCIAFGVFGVVLGSAGAALAMILDRIRRPGRPAPTT